MKLVFISDTHDHNLTKMNIPDGDILIHCGDATGRGTLKSFIEFNRQLGELPHVNKIFVPGNHDWLFEKDPNFAKNIVSNAICLIDEDVSFNGIKFYGSPWQPEFCNWAFNLPRGEKLREKWNCISDTTDVLITHSPPFGILDMFHEDFKEKHVGCEQLLLAVNRIKPKVHAYGHIHFSNGEFKNENTHFINASICSEQYKPINKPIVVEL